MKDKKYSLQDMLITCFLIFVGGFGGGALTGGSNRTDYNQSISRIENRLDTLTTCVRELKADVRELKLVKKLGK